MGILNVTPDSFFDGGIHNQLHSALEHGLRLVAEGADILDLGGESTRPGAVVLSAAEEKARVIPVIQALRQKVDVPISIDTYKAEVAAAALAAGADIVNDISGMQFDPEMVDVVRQYESPVVLMHIQGRPGTMQQNPVYENVVREVYWYFDERIEFALANGLVKDQLILDPGIGFGKREEDNYRLMQQLEVFQEFGCPVLLGPSRKSFLKRAGAKPEDRLDATSAAVAAAILKGVQLIRIHDVLTMKRVAVTIDLIRNYHS
ncbi:dihydropteroate synthase [bacterium]|nr:dihydropteroate synthase [bacterium]